MWARIGIGVATVIVIVVAAAAVAPYFVGLSAESHFKAQVMRLNSRLNGINFGAHVKSYHRSFYSSEATVSITLAGARSDKEPGKSHASRKGGNNEPGHVLMDMRFHISHGPIPFAAFGYGHWNFTPVLYTAEFRGSSSSSVMLGHVFKPDLYIVRHFTDHTHYSLDVPPSRIGLSRTRLG